MFDRRRHSLRVHTKFVTNLGLYMNRTVTLLFLPRDAMHKRGRYAVARCPFVRLSRSWLLWK